MLTVSQVFSIWVVWTVLEKNTRITTKVDTLVRINVSIRNASDDYSRGPQVLKDLKLECDNE